MTARDAWWSCEVCGVDRPKAITMGWSLHLTNRTCRCPRCNARARPTPTPKEAACRP